MDRNRIRGYVLNVMRVPQGSVLGPKLCNIFYDKLLKTKLPIRIQLIAFADDLSILIVDKKKKKLKQDRNGLQNGKI